MKRPPSLIKGDKIGIVAPARKISLQELEPAFSIIHDQGYEVVYDEELFATDHQLAGSDHIRAEYFQRMLDDKDIKAIFCARGGYGTVRIIDKLNFITFKKNPKWIVGYSDMTVLHSHINKNCGIQTLQASMPINFKENSPEALDGLFGILKGKLPDYSFDSHELNKNGHAKGILSGGNLSVLYSLMGSKSFPETKGKVLFLEDLDEYLYHIDRMMMAFKRAGILDDLAGLVVGGMTDMNDNEIPFGKTAEEIIAESVSDFDYPVCFGFPAGHIDDNRPLIMGAEVQLDVGEECSLNFL